MKKSSLVAGVALAAMFGICGAARAADEAAGLPEVDRSVDPCENFYRFACGPWQKANPIPNDQSSWGSFNILAQNNQTLLRESLDKLVAAPTAEDKKLADFYGSCMAEDQVEMLGFDPIRPLLSKIEALPDKKALAKLLADLHLAGIGVFFNFGSQVDFQDARMDIAAVAEGGLGLPNRDFYFREGEKDDMRRKAYVEHIGKMFQLLGDDAETAAAKAKTVMAIETALAQGSLTLAQQQDPKLTNHKEPLASLDKWAPGFAWSDYFAAIHAPQFAKLNVAEPDFVKAMQAQLATLSLGDIKTYLAWQTAHHYAPYLSKAFVDENFAFYGKVLSGAPEIRPRWKRCVQLTDQRMGEALGKFFVAKAFGPQHKARMLELVKNVKAAMDQDIEQLAWMGPTTKKQAHIKLAAIIDKIGYPDHWRDYSKLTVIPGDLADNVRRATAFEADRDVQKIGKKHDKREWEMTPPTVNAYYDPTENDINFPAGILQPPFFNMASDDAINYGAIGLVIGHEITHGFDDQGRQYDKDGNLKDWWTPEDAKKFEERAQCVVDQYGSYVAIDDLKQNGQATLGENLADNGGHRISFAALQKLLAGRQDKKEGGFTAEQRYFLGFAQVWCGNMRDETKRTRAMSDVHSLPEFRVNGTVSNSEAFAKAFNCKPDAPMVRGGKSCQVW